MKQAVGAVGLEFFSEKCYVLHSPAKILESNEESTVKKISLAGDPADFFLAY